MENVNVYLKQQQVVAAKAYILTISVVPGMKQNIFESNNIHPFRCVRGGGGVAPHCSSLPGETEEQIRGCLGRETSWSVLLYPAHGSAAPCSDSTMTQKFKGYINKKNLQEEAHPGLFPIGNPDCS